MAWTKNIRSHACKGQKNKKNHGNVEKKGGGNDYNAIVQSVHPFLVSVILNRTFHCATLCFLQADIYRVAKEVGTMIVCHIFDRSMVVDPIL